jgi:hypothetical protein
MEAHPGAVGANVGAFEGRKPVVADSHDFAEEQDPVQDPDSHQRKRDPDRHQSEKPDPEFFIYGFLIFRVYLVRRPNDLLCNIFIFLLINFTGGRASLEAPEPTTGFN